MAKPVKQIQAALKAAWTCFPSFAIHESKTFQNPQALKS